MHSSSKRFTIVLNELYLYENSNKWANVKLNN